MHLLKIFAIFTSTASIAVAAPSAEYNQITVKISTNPAAASPQNHDGGDSVVVHSSPPAPAVQELVVPPMTTRTNSGDHRTVLKDLPFSFSLISSTFSGPDGEPFQPQPPGRLPFGFPSETSASTWPKGLLGAATLFTIQKGKLIVVNPDDGQLGAVGPHPVKSYYPLTTLLPLKGDLPTFDFVVRPDTTQDGKHRYFLEFADGKHAFSASDYHLWQPLYVINKENDHLPRVGLELVPVYDADHVPDDANNADDDSSKDLL